MKRLDDLTILDEFSVRGRWFLRDHPNDVVPGELQFSSAGIRLKLDDHFQILAAPTALERILQSQPFKAPVIFGTTATGELCTLRRTFAAHIGGGECEFVANELLVGAHVENDAEGRVGAAMADFTHLEEWAYVPQFRFESNADQRNGFSFPTEPLEVLRVDDAPPFKSLVLRSAVQQQWRRTELHAKIRTSIRAEFSAGLSITDARMTVDSLANLFSLLVGDAVYPIKVRLIMPAELHATTLDVFGALREHRTRIEYGPDMTLPLSELSEEAAGLIRKWFMQEPTLRPVYSLLLSTVRAPNQYVQSTYLSLVQAIESFHRIAYGGYYESTKAYESIEEALSRAIPSEASDGLKSKLQVMLKYGNHFSLRKRLKDLFDRLGPTLTDKFLGVEKLSDFVGSVVDLRNYLTHHDESSSPGVSRIANNTVKMYNLNQRLRALTTALVFAYLGMPEHHVMKLFSIRNLNLAQ